MAGTEIGKAWVQIVPSAKGISGSIEKVLGGEADSAGKKAGLGIAGGIKKIIIAGGIGATLGKALGEGAKLQQSYLGGLDTLYGNAADKAREYARAAVQAGISQNEFSEQAVSFGAALRQAYGGDSAKAVEAANTAIMDMADNAAKMGTPLQSIQDAYQGFARGQYVLLDNLRLGYGGTKSEMERLLSDAEKISGQKYDISNLGDVYDAIHVIQGELGLTGVAAAEASETFSGSLATMKAAGQNVLGNLMLGENVGASMQDLATTATTFLFDNLIPAVGQVFASLPEAIGAAIQTGLPIIGEKAAELITALTNGINTGVPQLAASLPMMVTSALASLSGSLPAVAAKGVELISGLGNAIITNAPTLASAAAGAIEALAGFISSNLPTMAAKGGELIGQLAAGFIKNLPKIAVAAAKVGVFLVSNLGNLVASMISAGLSLIGGVASGITSGIGSKIRSAMTNLKSAITKPIEEAKEKVKGILDKIKGFFPLSVGRIFSNLKVPHINISGGSPPFGIGGLGSKPSISVTWNAKAMKNPYMFTGATIFGAGEAGDEILYSRESLIRDMREAAGGGRSVQNTFYITVNGAEDPEDYADRFVREMKLKMRTA